MKKAAIVTVFMLTLFIGLIFITGGITGLSVLNLPKTSKTDITLTITGLLFLFMTFLIFSTYRKELLK